MLILILWKKTMSINKFIRLLKQYKNILSKQQIKTMRGQALNGDLNGARKGLEKLLNKYNTN